MKWAKGAVCALLLTALTFRALPSAAVPEYSVYSHGVGDSCRIALTFDDGPHGRYTAEILDLLKEYGVPATFFVIGENAEKYPELIRREIEEGHEIGNHTYTHIRISEIGEDELFGEITKTEDALLWCREYCPRCFRPPEGRYDIRGIDMLQRLGYNVVLWSVDTRDWRGLSASKIIKTVRSEIRGGSIILCHDFVSGKSHTAEALRTLIPELLSQGYEFVTASELLQNEI